MFEPIMSVMGQEVCLPEREAKPAMLPSWRERIRLWKYDAAVSKRDLRLDLLRGLCLVVMIIDHLPLSNLHQFTSNFIGTISAAEGFVFISGMVVYLAHIRRFAEQGFGAVWRKLWSRALQLYAAHVVLLTILVTIHLSGLRIFQYRNLLRRLHDPLNGAFELLLLRLTPFGFNILPLYILLLVVAPLAWLLIKKNRAVWIPVFSALCYVLAHMFPNINHWTIVERDRVTFPFFVWQFLFFTGFTIAHYRKILANWISSRRLILSIFVCAGFVSFFLFRQYLNANPSAVNPIFMNFWFDKDMLNPGRILNFCFVGAVLWFLIDRAWKPVMTALGAVLIPLGQASLYVYLWHVLFVYAVRITILPESHLWATGIFDAGLILVIWMLVRFRVLFRVIPH